MELLIGGNWGFLEEAPCRDDPNLICHGCRKLPHRRRSTPTVLLLALLLRKAESTLQKVRLFKCTKSKVHLHQ